MRKTNRSPVGIERAKSQRRAWSTKARVDIKALLLAGAVAGLYLGTIALLFWMVLDATGRTWA